VTEPPALGLEWCERSPDLVLGACPDTAAAGKAHPAATVEQQADHGHGQYSRHRERVCSRRDEGERACRYACGAARRCPAQSPVLLAAGVAQTQHWHKLTTAPDERRPGSG